jgi:hypothetical protein
LQLGGVWSYVEILGYRLFCLKVMRRILVLLLSTKAAHWAGMEELWQTPVLSFPVFIPSQLNIYGGKAMKLPIS